MFYLIKNWKITQNSSTNYLKSEWFNTIELNLTDEQKEKLFSWYDLFLLENWEIEIKETKEVKIRKFKEIKKEAVQKRSEYITAELLPEGTFKIMSLEKLEKDRIDIEARYNDCINNLVLEYWEEILKELI